MDPEAYRQALDPNGYCEHVYAHLDNRRPQAALQEACRLLSLSPSLAANTLTPWNAVLKHPHAESLKALSLARLNSRKLAIESADRLAEQWLFIPQNAERFRKGYHYLTAMAVAQTYQAHFQDSKAASVFEQTFNAVVAVAPEPWPAHLDGLGWLTFDALISAQMYKKAQTLALQLAAASFEISSGFGPRRKDSQEIYFWWGMACCVINANQAPADKAKRLLSLAEQMIVVHQLNPSNILLSVSQAHFDGSPSQLERFLLYLSILTKQSKWRESFQLLETPAGRRYAGLPLLKASGAFKEHDPSSPLGICSPLLVTKGLERIEGAFEGLTIGEGIVGNPNVKEIRWKVVTTLEMWKEIREEMTWRVRNGDRDWKTLKTLITSVIKHDNAQVIDTTRAFLDALLPQAVIAGGNATAAPLHGQGGGEAAAGSSTASTSGAKNKKKRQAQNKRNKAAAMKERPLLLARIELAKQISETAALQGKVQDSQTLAPLIVDYFEQFSTERCAYEDLRPYAAVLDSKQKQELSDVLRSTASPSVTLNDEPALVRHINAHKLRRFLQDYSSASPESEIALAQEYFGAYIRGLPIGKSLPKTETQPADDLAFLSASALVSAWSLLPCRNGSRSKGTALLFDAASILDYALRFSPKGCILRLLLARICLTLGAFSVALEHFNELEMRPAQLETMAHWIFERFSAWASVEPEGQGPLPQFSQFYKDKKKETTKFIWQAFVDGNYSKVEESVELHECSRFSLNMQLLNKELMLVLLSRLDVGGALTLARDILGATEPQLLEEERMQILLNSGDVEGATTLAQEIDATEPRVGDEHRDTLRDQRDFDVLPSYMPHGAQEIAEMLGTGPRQWTADVRTFARLVLGKQTSEAETSMTAWEAALTTAFSDSESAQRALVKSASEDFLSPFQLLHLGETALQISCIIPTVFIIRMRERFGGARLRMEDELKGDKLPSELMDQLRRCAKSLADSEVPSAWIGELSKDAEGEKIRSSIRQEFGRTFEAMCKRLAAPM